MPVDFEPYVLSSSPPGFDLNYVLNDHYVKQDQDERRRPRRSRFGKSATWHEISATLAEENEVAEEAEAAQMTRPDLTNPKIRQRISSWDSHYQCDPDAQKCICPAACGAGMGKRKVSFADELGRQLEAIQIMEDASDVPPMLQSNIAERFASDNSEISAPKLALNFHQPASDYMTFRNTIESKLVSLENVVVRGYSVSGTIRVKNVSFEKTVAVRYTLNSWKTYVEQQAVFVPSGVADDRFNTFSFSIECPPDLKSGNKLQFAVRYVACGGQEFWDSNNGDNYEVMYVSSGSNGHMSASGVDSYGGHAPGLWTEFSGWSSVDLDSPYW